MCVAGLILNENILTGSAPTGICKVKACFFHVRWVSALYCAIDEMPEALNGNHHLLFIATIAVYIFFFLFGSLFGLGHIQRCKPLRLQDKLDKSR